MKRNRPTGLGLIAALFALGSMAFGATTASATKVTPPETAITATNIAETRTTFIPENAYSEISIDCEVSSAEFETPSEVPPAGTNNNMNRGPEEGTPSPVGTFSKTPGSVTMDLNEPPEFNECGVFVQGVEEPVAGATVETNNENGDWTVVGLGGTLAQGYAAIGVPQDGATIEIDQCVITVSPTQSSVVTAKHFNKTHSLRVDGQLDYEDNGGPGCVADDANPAQFEGSYQVSNEFRINP